MFVINLKCFALTVFLYLKILNAVHIKGTFDSKDFSKFLVRYGFQRTDNHNSFSSGFIYGNITSKRNDHNGNVTMVVLNEKDFSDYYKKINIKDKEKACKNIFDNFGNGTCNGACCTDQFKYLHRIPCEDGKLCNNGKPMGLVDGYQFSLEIKDYQRPRFWYLNFVACYQNRETCNWHYFEDILSIDYDIWVVNGNPNKTSFDTFTYQFSFEKHNTAEFYVLFFFLYGLLLPVQIYAVTHQRHPITKIFTAGLTIQCFNVFLSLFNSLKFAFDGEGVENLVFFADILDILSRTVFMMMLVLLAKGWAITRIELSWRPFIFLIWFLYAVVHIIFYMWNMSKVNIAEGVDQYQTYPGWLILMTRFIIIVWFILELRNTMKYEHNSKKLNFFLHFGASGLVWLIYLPTVTLISLQVPTLWRYKLFLGVVFAADFLSYCIMMHLLWPTRNEQYFLLAGTLDTGADELDVFNEAPHIINSHSYSHSYSPSSSPVFEVPCRTQLIDI